MDKEFLKTLQLKRWMYWQTRLFATKTEKLTENLNKNRAIAYILIKHISANLYTALLTAPLDWLSKIDHLRKDNKSWNDLDLLTVVKHSRIITRSG